MKNKKVIDGIENEFYELIGQINYGELSNISTYWSSFGDALLKLDIKGWSKPEINEVSGVLQSINGTVDFDSDLVDLIELASEMEGLSEERGSTGELDEEDLDRLQSLAVDFEELFIFFLQKMREIYA